jgi:hypothetical protein
MREADQLHELRNADGVDPIAPQRAGRRFDDARSHGLVVANRGSALNDGRHFMTPAELSSPRTAPWWRRVTSESRRLR